MLAYGSFVVAAFLILVTHITGLTTNPYYSTASVFSFFLSVIFVYFIALQNSPASFLLSFTLTTAFSQRFIVTYFYPENIDFINHVQFTNAEIEYSIFFYTACVGGGLLGLVIGNFLPKVKTGKNEHSQFAGYAEYIQFFVFKLKSVRFLKIVVIFYLLLVLVKVLVISITGIGLTGAMHEADQSLFHWLSSRSGIVSGYAFFSVLLLKQYDNKTRFTKFFFFFYAAENILMASRSFALSIIQGLTVSFYLLKKRIKKKYIIIAGVAVLFSVTVYYTALTVLRGYLLTGEIYFSNESTFLTVSRGFSQLDPLLLWVDMPSKLYEGSVGLWADLKLFINSFAIGDIIPDPNRINLGKLMVQYGRQDDFDIFALAGHAENPGAFATTYMYLGFFGGTIYWIFLGLFLKILERSDIHLFWQYAFVNSFATGPAYTLYTTGSALIAPMVLIGFAVVVYEGYRFVKLLAFGKGKVVWRRKNLTVAADSNI